MNSHYPMGWIIGGMHPEKEPHVGGLDNIKYYLCTPQTKFHVMCLFFEQYILLERQWLLGTCLYSSQAHTGDINPSNLLNPILTPLTPGWGYTLMVQNI